MRHAESNCIIRNAHAHLGALSRVEAGGGNRVYAGWDTHLHFPSSVFWQSLRSFYLPNPPSFKSLLRLFWPYSCCSSMVMFNELLIAFRTLYGPMNLGMSFCALLDIDHWWISNKSIPLHVPPLYPFCPQVRSISVMSLTPLHSSLFPLFHPSSLHFLFHWYLSPCHDPLGLCI